MQNGSQVHCLAGDVVTGRQVGAVGTVKYVNSLKGLVSVKIGGKLWVFRKDDLKVIES